MNEPPTVRLVPNPIMHAPEHSLSKTIVDGFDEFDRWMKFNDAQWNHASRRCESMGVSDSERLKFLAAEMARQKIMLTKRMVEHVERFGADLIRAIDERASAASVSTRPVKAGDILYLADGRKGHAVADS